MFYKIIEIIRAGKRYYWLKKMTKETDHSFKKSEKLPARNQKSPWKTLEILGEKRF